MKASPWFLGGVAAAALAGLGFFGVAFLQPGQVSEMENVGGAGKPLLAEAKKKTEVVQQGRFLRLFPALLDNLRKMRSRCSRWIPKW